MKTYNFCSGPAILPDEVLKEASQALVDWAGTGTSILAVSHRSDEFKEIVAQAEQDLRTLLSIPSDYHVLFLSGGASAQFAMLPMNLLGLKKTADYVNTGYWSQMAIKEAERYCKVRVIAKGTEAALAKKWDFHPEAAYVHCVMNETVEGIAIPVVPDCESVPVVADMSSCLLSAPVDINRFGLIYAGSHKNIGPAGMTVVIVRKDLIKETLPNTPSLYSYSLQADYHSLFNTPPTFALYVAGLVFKWLIRQGGLGEMLKINRQKAQLLYDAIDHSRFYKNQVLQACRSMTNITFQLKPEASETDFLQEAKARGLLNLKGHRSIGGLRASLYNAMPIEGVKALIHFMREFENRHA